MGMEFDRAFDPFRALRHGIAALRHDPPTVLLAGLLMTAIGACGGGGSGGNFEGSTDGGMSPELVMFGLIVALLACCLGLLAFLARGYIEPGAWRAGARITEEGTAGMDTLFSGQDAWLPMLGYLLLRGLISLGVFVVTALPGGLLLALAFARGSGGEPDMPLAFAGSALILVLVLPIMIYVQLGLFLGNLAVALDDCRPMEALERSWNLARGHRLQLLIFQVVNALVLLAGFLACCVGIIPARGVVICATANAYLLHTRDEYEDFALVREEGLV